MRKKLIIAGGTGFLGHAVRSFFENSFDEIVVLSRGKSATQDKTRFVHWNGETTGDWCSELEGASVLLNTAGKSVDCRFNKKNRNLILSSRVNSTKILGETILKCETPPSLWINCSSAAIYGYSDTAPVNETSPENGTDFMATVAKEWENTFYAYNAPGIRKAILRISLIFGNGGGVYPVLRSLAKKGLGGKMGSGNQVVSWVHIEDICRVIDWMINNPSASGAYNIAAPEAVKNKDLMMLLRKQVKVPFGFPSPAWTLKLGGFLIQKEPALLLESHNTYPARLLKEGFSFTFSSPRECIASLG